MNYDESLANVFDTGYERCFCLFIAFKGYEGLASSFAFQIFANVAASGGEKHFLLFSV